MQRINILTTLTIRSKVQNWKQFSRYHLTTVINRTNTLPYFGQKLSTRVAFDLLAFFEMLSHRLIRNGTPILTFRSQTNSTPLIIKMWIYSVPPSVFYDPQLQIICCYIARYYVRNSTCAWGS